AQSNGQADKTPEPGFPHLFPKQVEKINGGQKGVGRENEGSPGHGRSGIKIEEEMPESKRLANIQEEKKGSHHPEKHNHRAREFGQGQIFLLPEIGENKRSKVAAGIQ